jgi:membrane protease subunit HflK
MKAYFGRDDNDSDRGTRRYALIVGGLLRDHWPKLLGVVAIALMFTSVYSIGPGEQGVVRTFGRETGKTGPGLHYRFPFIQQVDVVNIEQIRRVEIGFNGDQRKTNESLMITGDENVVEAQMIVQYRVADPSRFLFRLVDPEETLRSAAEVALRSAVGRTVIDDVITTGREKVQEDTRAWLQSLLDSYESGLSVTEVKLLVVDAPDEVRDAFHDVVRAREEKEKLINQARGYQADLIPRARGEARQIEREAEAYKEQRILRASGDASRFAAMAAEYAKAQRVTRERLHIETMERILARIDRTVIVDSEIAKNASPILPIVGAQVAAAVTPPPAAPAAPPAAREGGQK